MYSYDRRSAKADESKHPKRRIEVKRGTAWIEAMLEEELADGSVWAKTDHVKKYKPGQWRERDNSKTGSANTTLVGPNWRKCLMAIKSTKDLFETIFDPGDHYLMETLDDEDQKQVIAFLARVQKDLKEVSKIFKGSRLPPR